MNLHHFENFRFCKVCDCRILLVESLDSVAELPTAVGQQLQHLVKGRPRRAKTRAPSRPMLRSAEIIEDVQDLGEGLDTFFRPGSVTPTGTPLVSPTSDDRYLCTLSLYHSFLSSSYCLYFMSSEFCATLAHYFNSHGCQTYIQEDAVSIIISSCVLHQVCGRKQMVTLLVCCSTHLLHFEAQHEF